MSMKQRVAVQQFRDSIDSVVRALSKKNVKVTQRGNEPKIVYDTCGKPIAVNIPTLPDDADAKLIDAVRGFIDLQVASILFTDFELYPRGGSSDSIFKSVEASRVEREMNMLYPGSKKNIRGAFSFAAKQKLREAVDEAKDDKQLISCILDAYIHARAGSKTCEAFLDENVSPAILEFLDKKIGDIVERIKHATSTSDSVSIAHALRERLKEKERPLEAPPSFSTEESETPEESKPTEEHDETESSESDKEHEESKEDQESSEPHADEGEDGEEDETPKSESEQEGEGDGDCDASDEENKDSGEEESSEAEETGSEDASEDAPSSGEGDVETESDDASADTGDGDVSDDSLSGSGDDLSEGSPSDVGEYRPETGTAPLREVHEIPDLGDIEPDLIEDALESSISEAAIKTSANNFLPYTRDFDEVIEPNDVLIHSLERHKNNTRSLVTKMTSKMRRLLAAKSDCVKYGGLKRGKLNSSALFRVAVGDDRVFYKKTESVSQEVAITLLIDLSGSMFGQNKICVAMQSAEIFASVLSKLNINFEILGFTALTRSYHRMSKEDHKQYRDLAYPRGPYTRISPITTYVFKAFGNNYSKKEMKRMIAASETKGIKMEENLDGDSVEYALNRLATQPEPRKIMFVFSDGMPSSRYEDHRVLSAHLKGVVQKAEKDGFEIIGIGIKTSAVKSFYENNVVVNNIKELPNVTMKELERILLK